MNYNKILENGYEKLAVKLPDNDKALLFGFEHAIACVMKFRCHINDYIETDIESIAKIEREIAKCTVDNAIEFLRNERTELTVSMIDNNHYSINENGEITDEGQ